MSNTFTITYASGVKEDVQMEAETVDEVANSVFGLTMEAAAEMGCNVTLVGPYEPPAPDLTGTITAFSASMPTVATTDAEDQGVLLSGGTITLEALTGDQEAMDYINTKSVLILSVSPFIQLDLDLSEHNVTGLTLDYCRIDVRRQK